MGILYHTTGVNGGRSTPFIGTRTLASRSDLDGAVMDYMHSNDVEKIEMPVYEFYSRFKVVDPKDSALLGYAQCSVVDGEYVVVHLSKDRSVVTDREWNPQDFYNGLLA